MHRWLAGRFFDFRPQMAICFVIRAAGSAMVMCAPVNATESYLNTALEMTIF